MNMGLHHLNSHLIALCKVMRHELRTLLRDEGVLLVLLGAPLIYGLLYASAYGAEVVREVPIGVIDESKTTGSRQLSRLFEAGPECYIRCSPSDMEEARQLLLDREIYGIVYIPADYEKRLLGGEQAVVLLYLDTSYFLIYRQLFQELVLTIESTGAGVELVRLLAQGSNLPQAEAVVEPIRYTRHDLFNPALGYGVFVMPAILILILQQTLLIGIGMVGATWREEGFYHAFARHTRHRPTPLTLLLGRGAAYLLLCAPTTLYLFTLHYRLFGLPMQGSTPALLLFMTLYLTTCILFGLALSPLFRRREEPLMLLFWSSIPLLMLSGISLPREGMPEWLYLVGKLLPSSHAVNGWIRLQSMGASIGEVAAEIGGLVGLLLCYALLAVWGVMRRQRIP